jgi:hypothetical protein
MVLNRDKENALSSPIVRPAPFFAAIALALLAAPLGCGPSRPKVDRFHTADRMQASEYPDVPAVVLLDRTELSFSFSTEKNRPYAQAIHLRRIQILNEKGLAYQKLNIPYDHLSEVLHIQGRVIKPDGQVVEMPSDRAIDLDRFPAGSPAGRLYNAKAFKMVKIGNAEVGDVLELSYVRVWRDPRWLLPVQVGSNLPTKRGEVIVEHPIGFDVDFRVTKLGRVAGVRPQRLPITVKDPNNPNLEGVPGARHVFIFDREPAIFPEEMQPHPDALTTQVHVQLRNYNIRGKTYRGFSSWDDLAKWHNAVLAGNDRPDSVVKKRVRQDIGLRGKKRDKIRQVQRYMQDRVGDAPSFGHLASLPSRTPGGVLSTMVGDSKDQAATTRAILRALGFDGVYVLVSRKGTFATIPDLPTPAPFNHVLLAVPQGGGWAFIDPATPYLPLGRLPGALQGQRGVLVRGDRGELIDLPSDQPQDNTRAVNYELEMGADGMVKGTVSLELKGLEAAEAAALIAREGQAAAAAALRKWVDPSGESRLVWQNARALRALDDTERPLKITAAIAPTPLATRQPEGLAFSLQALLGKAHPYAWREMRKAPLLFDHVKAERIRVSLAMPESMGLGSMPADGQLSSNAIEFMERWAVADGKMILERVFITKTRVVEPEAYRQAIAPIRQLWSAEARPVFFTPGGNRGRAYGNEPF